MPESARHAVFPPRPVQRRVRGDLPGREHPGTPAGQARAGLDQLLAIQFSVTSARAGESGTRVHGSAIPCPFTMRRSSRAHPSCCPNRRGSGHSAEAAIPAKQGKAAVVTMPGWVSNSPRRRTPCCDTTARRPDDQRARGGMRRFPTCDPVTHRRPAIAGWPRTRTGGASGRGRSPHPCYGAAAAWVGARSVPVSSSAEQASRQARRRPPRSQWSAHRSFGDNADKTTSRSAAAAGTDDHGGRFRGGTPKATPNSSRSCAVVWPGAEAHRAR